MSENTKAVAYYRVSTSKQGESGLGLESQENAVKRYAAANGLTIISPPGEFTEIETGTNKRRRPKLHAAMRLAKEHKAILLIAKIDRLARNVHFISGLMESGVKFIAVDMPTIDNLTIHILAAVAEKEAKLISERTRAGLAVAKARGTILGKPENMTHEAQKKGAAVRRQQAINGYKTATRLAQSRREQGWTYQQIANELNDIGERTTRGKLFTKMTVKRMLDRVVTVTG